MADKKKNSGKTKSKKRLKGTGIVELVKKIKTRMTAEEIDEQLRQMREE